MSSTLVRLLLLTALLAPAAHAADPTPEQLARAAEIYENAAILYEEGSYEAAIAGFRAALELSGKPELHYNIANCLERMGRLKEAYEELNLYRAFAPAEERERLDRRMRVLDERIAEEQRLASATPAPTPAPIPAPTTAPVSAPVSSGAAPAGDAGRHPRWGLVGVGVGAGLAGGVGVTLSWLESRADLEAGDEASYNQARVINLASWAGVGVGAALAGVGVVFPAGGRELRVGPGSISMTW